MARGFVHTLNIEGRWQNEVEGAAQSAALETFDTKDEAVAAGRAEARRRHTEHVIHRANGSVEDRNSYGNDPAHRPG